MASSFPVGEPKKRHPLLAFALGVVAPGLGHMYVGRVAQAIAVAVVVTVVPVLVFAVYVVEQRDLVQMLDVARAVTGVLWLSQALLAAVLARRAVGYRTTKANHPGAYFAFVGGTRLGAIVIERVVVGGALLGVLPASGPEMHPVIDEGAQVAVVRWKFDPAFLAVGDVVCWDAAQEGEPSRPSFARVVATARQTVAFAGGALVVDGTPTPQRPCTPEEALQVGDDRGRCRVEVLGGKGRVVLSSLQDAPPGAPITVPDGAVLLLGDDRDRARAGDPVPFAKIYGRAAAVVSGKGRRGVVR